ncbi:MAG: hypothetical protein KatS3mg008_0309 [Acidimicrobiales bacterium]|nr:MAG: hypothetical protein KatS3mg008_0309 [Acidimicrobiales bacterium]
MSGLGRFDQDHLYPFTAVVGHEEAKLALCLLAVEPRIGGVLLRGDKGAAKTTLARSLARLMGDAPFVDLPLGATEDSVVGTLDLRGALESGERRFKPGLLARAHGGVLYVDEVNLLADHLVDVLLDAAVSGVNVVEREGVTHRHPARFVLVGSMNPEEGDLRPQLLDRFGLSVEVRSSRDPAERAEALRRRLAFDEDPAGFVAAWEDEERRLAERLGTARPARLSDDLFLAAAALAVEAGAQGLRADLTMVRAAAALAGLEGREEARLDDLRRVAPLALAHRLRRDPFDDPAERAADLDEVVERFFDRGPTQNSGAMHNMGGGRGDDAAAAAMDGEQRTAEAGGRPGGPLGESPPNPTFTAAGSLLSTNSTGRPDGRRSPNDRGGRKVGERKPEGEPTSIATAATVREAILRRSTDPDAPLLEVSDLREAVTSGKGGNLLVFAVDTSGSMGAARRVEAVRSAVSGFLADAYVRRDRVAVVAFAGEAARVVLRPTSSVEVARARLSELPVGGTTPLGEGIRRAAALADKEQGSDRAILILVTDGRATWAKSGDPVDDALEAARAVRRAQIPSVVVDAEDPRSTTGLAADVAAEMGAMRLPLHGLDPEFLVAVSRRHRRTDTTRR